MRPRDLDTLELPRALEAIAALARSDAGRDAVRALRPATDRTEAEGRLDTLAELVALGSEAGPLPDRRRPASRSGPPAGGACGRRAGDALAGRGAGPPAGGTAGAQPSATRSRPLPASRRGRRRLARDTRRRSRAHHDARRARPGPRGREPGARGGATRHARAAGAARDAAPGGGARSRAGQRRRRPVRHGAERALRRAHPHRRRVDLRGRGAGPLRRPTRRSSSSPCSPSSSTIACSSPPRPRRPRSAAYAPS